MRVLSGESKSTGFVRFTKGNDARFAIERINGQLWDPKEHPEFEINAKMAKEEMAMSAFGHPYGGSEGTSAPSLAHMASPLSSEMGRPSSNRLAEGFSPQNGPAFTPAIISSQINQRNSWQGQGRAFSPNNNTMSALGPQLVGPGQGPAAVPSNRMPMQGGQFLQFGPGREHGPSFAQGNMMSPQGGQFVPAPGQVPAFAPGNTVPAKVNRAPTRGNMLPAQENMLQAQRNRMLVQHNRMPAQGSMMPAQGSMMPAQRRVKQEQGNWIPPQRNTMLVQGGQFVQAGPMQAQGPAFARGNMALASEHQVSIFSPQQPSTRPHFAAGPATLRVVHASMMRPPNQNQNQHLRQPRGNTAFNGGDMF